MSEYHSDNKTEMVNAAPLFASSWLALFSVLRENYIDYRAVTDPDERLNEGLILLKEENVVLLKDESVEQ